MIKQITVLFVLFFAFINALSTPISGKKSIGSGGTYPTMQAAFDALVANGVSGAVYFSILSGTYDEGVNLTSPIAGLSETNNISFSVGTGSVTWKAQKIASLSGSAAVRLGANKHISFSGITFDLDTTGTGCYGIYIDGSADSISISGCSFLNSKGVNGYAVIASGNNTLRNLNVTNSTFTGLDYGILTTRTAHASLSDSYIQITDNVFTQQSTYAVNLDAVKKVKIKNNTITGFTGSGIYVQYSFVEEISNNILNSNSSGNASGIGIYVYIKNVNSGSFGKIYNNMINIENRAASVKGIVLQDVDSMIVAHNTIYMTGNTVSQNCFQMAGTHGLRNVIKNNIFQQYDGTLYWSSFNPTTQNISSDYNLLESQFSGSPIRVVNTSYSVVNYTSTYGLESNSISKGVSFVGSGNLHLNSADLPDTDLTGEYLPDFSVDVDGDTRTEISSYMGADEPLGFALPVELASFTFSFQNKNLALNWISKSETNNYGWEIESKSQESDDWEKVGFVKGFGTTTSSQFYSYTFKQKANSINVRLKQIDLDGKFSYSNILTIQTQPETFELKQNYPNPFNPSTKIQFNLSEQRHTELKIYDLLGREIKTLINEEKPAGNYEILFDGSNLSSGVYVYQLKAGSQIQNRKMILSK